MRKMFCIGDRIYKVQDDVNEFYQCKLRAFEQFFGMDIALVNGKDEKGEYFDIVEIVDESNPFLLAVKLDKLEKIKTEYKNNLFEPLIINGRNVDFNRNILLSILLKPEGNEDIIIQFIEKTIEMNLLYRKIKKEIWMCNNVCSLEMLCNL